MLKGAEAVIGSLIAIDDIAALVLSLLTHIHLKAGKSPHAALAAAKSELRNWAQSSWPDVPERTEWKWFTRKKSAANGAPSIMKIIIPLLESLAVTENDDEEVADIFHGFNLNQDSKGKKERAIELVTKFHQHLSANIEEVEAIADFMMVYG